jgi:hypothetical protein
MARSATDALSEGPGSVENGRAGREDAAGVEAVLQLDEGRPRGASVITPIGDLEDPHPLTLECGSPDVAALLGVQGLALGA